SDAATFIIDDRLFYIGGYVFDLFYLELGQGPFQLLNPPFYLVRSDMAELYVNGHGNAVVVNQTAIIFTADFTTDNRVFLRINIGPDPVSYKFIKRNETQNSNISPGGGRPKAVVDKNGLIYMWFTPDKLSSASSSDENLYIFDTTKYSWSTVEPPYKQTANSGVDDVIIYDTVKGTWLNQSTTGTAEFAFQCMNGQLYNNKILCYDSNTNTLNVLNISSFAWSVHNVSDPSNNVVPLFNLVGSGAINVYQDWMIFSFNFGRIKSENRFLFVMSLANEKYEWISSTSTIPLVKDPNQSPPPRNNTIHSGGCGMFHANLYAAYG
ncbi:34335_t:CDS:2, partial [Gigaspora margarita]